MRAASMSRIGVGFAVLMASALPALAATESVIYSFTNSGTGYPLGSLYFKNGTFYGTGSGNEKAADGQVFKLTNSHGSWKEKTLLTFAGTNGSTPYPAPIRGKDGTFYGTNSTGDAYNGGNVYALSRKGGKWVGSTIWAFGGTSGDGAQPTSPLVMDKSGNLYGTTYSGGTYNVGTVFELSQVNGVWNETVLFSFSGKETGWYPYAGLLMAGSNTFYGTTQYGGDPGGDGTVFELSRSGATWKETVLYAFTGAADGGEPWGMPIRDKSGNLYGTTYAGGGNNEGVAFMLSRTGGKWTETVLHSFDSFNDDGANPIAGLTWGPSNSLYGTTSEGGTPGYPGVGIVFELAQSAGTWTETILHSFEGDSDGSYPQGGVTFDENGVLYGTTFFGGTANLGTVWMITP